MNAKLKPAHRGRRPFPWMRHDGSTVVDAKCECDHLQSWHRDHGAAFGQAECCVCTCDRFTWTNWILRRSRKRGGCAGGGSAMTLADSILARLDSLASEAEETPHEPATPEMIEMMRAQARRIYEAMRVRCSAL